MKWSARSRLRSVWLGVLVASIAALAVSLPALALNVLGSSGPDVLRGTPQSDWINGKGGNDRLLGLGGNDILTGGSGSDYVNGGPGDDRLLLRDGARDRAICGPGRDTVIGDHNDRIGADCEIARLTSPPSPERPPPPPPAPPAPSPPPTSPVTPGSFRGQTQTGNFVFFDILANRTVTGWRVNDIRRPCNGPLIIYGAVDLGQTVLSIDSQGRFGREFRYDTSIRNDKGELTPAVGVLRLTGTIQGSTASGTIYSSYEFTLDGRSLRCVGDETWTAARVS